MLAAVQASNETVSSLLSWGASPDKTNSNDNTALIFAIQSKCQSTINLLARVTQVNLGRAMQHMARDKIELETGELRKLLKRAAQEKEAAIMGLDSAALFGSNEMIAMIGQSHDTLISSTSKTRVAPPGICPGTPLAP